jgi:hypothetical protein
VPRTRLEEQKLSAIKWSILTAPLIIVRVHVPSHAFFSWEDGDIGYGTTVGLSAMHLPRKFIGGASPTGHDGSDATADANHSRDLCLCVKFSARRRRFWWFMNKACLRDDALARRRTREEVQCRSVEPPFTASRQLQ